MEKMVMQGLGAEAFMAGLLPQDEIWTVMASRAPATAGNRVLALLQAGMPPQITAVSPDCGPMERLRYNPLANLAAIRMPSLETFLTTHLASAPLCVQINMHAHLACKMPVVPKALRARPGTSGSKGSRRVEITPAEPEAGTVKLDGQRQPAVAMGVYQDLMALAVVQRSAGRASIRTRWVNVGDFATDAHGFALLARDLTEGHFDAGQQPVPIVDLAGEFARHAHLINNRVVHAAMRLILDHRLRHHDGQISSVDRWAFDQACAQLTDGTGCWTPEACATLLERATGLSAQLAKAETWRITKIEAMRALGERVNAEAIIEQVATMLAHIAVDTGIVKDTEADAARLMYQALDAWVVSACAQDALAREVGTPSGSRLACIGALRDPILRRRYHPAGVHRYYDLVLDTMARAIELDSDMPPIASSYVHAAVALIQASPTG